MANIQNFIIDDANYDVTGDPDDLTYKKGLVLAPRDTMIASTNLGNWNTIRYGMCFYPVEDRIDIGAEVDWQTFFSTSYSENFPASTQRDVFAFAFGVENKWDFTDSNYVGVFVGPDSGLVTSWAVKMGVSFGSAFFGTSYGGGTWSPSDTDSDMVKAGKIFDGTFDLKTPLYASSDGFGVDRSTVVSGDDNDATFGAMKLGHLVVQLQLINKGLSNQQIRVNFSIGSISGYFFQSSDFLPWMKQLNMYRTAYSHSQSYIGYPYGQYSGGEYVVDWHRSGSPLPLPKYLILNNPYLGIKFAVSNLGVVVSD